MKHEDSTLKVKQRVSDEQRRQVLDLRTAYDCPPMESHQ